MRDFKIYVSENLHLKVFLCLYIHLCGSQLLQSCAVHAVVDSTRIEYSFDLQPHFYLFVVVLYRIYISLRDCGLYCNIIERRSY